MISIDREHHKITRTSPAWGDWEYTYYERQRQKDKAHKLMREHHHEGRSMNGK